MPRVPAVILLFVATPLSAQVGSMRVDVPSPTAATLGKFGDVPVSLYTGVPDISIPIFTAQGRTFSLPIVLRYHAGGIRVEEIGGWAGLGWTLEAGGTITRTVRGLVDEGGGGYYCTGNTWYVGTNWQNPSQTVFSNLTTEQLDGEPDQFFYDFAGRSGQFVMGPTSATITEYRATPYQKLQIQPVGISPSCPGGIGGQISSWIITSEDGTRYTFGAAETSTDYNTTTPPGPIPAHFGDSYTSSWHLTGIHTAGGDTATLSYSTYVVRHKLSSYREKFDFISGGQQNCVPNQFDAINEYQVTAQYLSSISTAAHTITFTPGATLRQDALNSQTLQPQEPRLDKITVQTPTGMVLRIFQMDHDYSLGGRLTLKNVYEQDRNGVSLPPHTFTYGGPTLPERTSYALDHWGFYNGKTGNTTSIPAAIGPGSVPLSGADRGPDGAFATAGALTRVTYPTGGYSEFVYETNDYGGIGAGGATPKDYGPQQTSTLNSVAFGGIVTQTFTVGGTDAIIATVSVTLNPPNCGNQAGCPFAEIVGKGTWTAPGTYAVTLAPATYTQRIWDGDLGQSNSIAVSWRDLGPVNKKPGSGLRVSEVRTADAIGNVDTTKFKYQLLSDTTKSSGVVSVEPAYSYSYSSSQCSYYSRSSMSRMPLGGGPPVGYAEVTVWHGSTGASGKTRHTFRSVLTSGAADEPLVFQTGWPFSTRTSHETRRGQETGATEYNASGQTQRRGSSNYTIANDAETYRSFRGMSFNFFSAGSVGSIYVYNPFQVISEWAYMNEDTTVVYDEGGTNSFSAVRTYTYGNPVHLQLTQLTETNSNGTQRITRMKYPADYATGSGSPEAAAITAMQGTANIVNAVIERWVIDKSGGIEHVVQGDLTTWKEYAPGQFRPFQHFVLNSPSTLP